MRGADGEGPSERPRVVPDLAPDDRGDTGHPMRVGRTPARAAAGFLRIPGWTPLSPWKHLAITVAAVFSAEVVTTTALAFVPTIPYPWIAFADATAMAILAFPILYALSFRPLLVHIDEHHRFEAVLRQVHAERAQAASEREAHLRRLEVLLGASHLLLAETSVGGVLARLTESACAITGAKVGLVGRLGGPGAPHPPAAFSVPAHGAAAEALARHPVVRLTEEQRLEHPVWSSLLPEDVPARGLLAARLIDRAGAPWGVVALTDRREGEFTAEDEAMLAPLAVLGSLALQHIQARSVAQEKADELDAVFDSMVEAVVICDREGTIRRANTAAVTALGANPVGGRLPEVFRRLSPCRPNGEKFSSGELPVVRTLAGERVEGQRILLTTADGQDAVVLATTTPLRTAGTVTGAVTVWKDVTDRERAEEALRDSEDRYRTFLQNFQGIAFRANLGVAPLFFHGAVEAITGYSEAELLAGSPRWQEVIHPDDVAEATRTMDQARSSPEFSAEREYRIVRKDGKTRWLREYIQNACDQDGTPTLVQGAIYDITDRMEAERHRAVTHALLELFARKSSRQEYLAEVVELVRAWTAVACVGVSLGDAPDDDVPEAQAGFDTTAHAPGLGSVAVVPIRYRDRTLGAVRLADPRIDAVSPGTLEFVESIVPLLGEALQRFNLEEELRRFAREQSVLHAVATAATSFLEPASLLEAVLDVVLPALDTDAGWIALPGPDAADPPRVVASLGVSEALVAAEEGAPFASCPTCGPILCDGVVADAPWPIPACPRLAASVLDASDLHSHVSVPLSAGGELLGVLNVAWREEHRYTAEERTMLRAVGDLVGVALANAQLFTQVRAERERLQALSRRLVEVQENERMVVARELHDDAGQTLTALWVAPRLPARVPDNPQAVRDRIGELKRTADGVLENLHRLASNLRPASLDHLGLVATLRQHAQSLSAAGGSAVSFEANGFDSKRLPPAVENALYRIAQEAMSNAVRHARASRVGITLDRGEERILIAVEDDGTGFDPVEAARGGRLGLVGMRERVEMLGGTMAVQTAPGAGTAILVEVPYADQDPHRR